MRKIKLNIFKSNQLEIHNIDKKSRDKNLIKQIFSSVSFKAISVLMGIALVPLLLNKLGEENYGIWSLLLSLVQWVSLMDIGIGNGLRNKLTESLAANKIKDAREYVSTAYYLMSSIAFFLIIILLPLFFLIDLNQILNSKNLLSVTEARWIMMMFVYSMLIYFVLSLLNQVMNAVQRNSLTAISPIVTNVFFIAVIYFFSPSQNGRLLFVSITYCLSLILSIIIASYFFYKAYSNLIPKFEFFKKDKVKSLLSLGGKFFIIQITVIIIFSTDNVIITQLFGPKFITVYNIPFIVFNNIAMLANIVMMPFYSSYTEAYTKGNLDWIQSKIVLLCKLIIPFIFVISIVIYFFSDIIKIWIGNSLEIPSYLPFLIGLYSVVSVWNNIFGSVLGSIGKINLGMYSTIFQGLLNVPLSIYLARDCGFGLNGIIISNIICIGISSILSPIQVYYFIFSTKSSDRLTKILS